MSDSIVTANQADAQAFLWAGSIAHEQRNYLASIKLNIELLQHVSAHLIGGYQQALKAQLIAPAVGETLPRKLERLIKIVFDTINKATKMMNLQLANTQQGYIDDKRFVDCSILQIVREALALYPFGREERTLVHWDGLHGFHFQGDALLYQHVLWNLLKNALRAIQVAGKGEVFIRFEKGEQYNLVYFKDTALGIATENINKIFDPNYTTGGCGLGLAFCKVAMQAFGGDIRCESTVGEFTRFILSVSNA